MLCATHRLIAKNVYEVLRSELNITLNYKSLLDGSVAPDSNPLMLVIPHYKNNQSLGFVSRYVDKLLCMQVDENTQVGKDFSFKLGVVIHYISDYFCRAHNDIKYLNPIAHYFYEKRLKHYFNNCLTKAKLLVRTDRNKIVKTIREFIEDRHGIYLLEVINMESDFAYTMEMVLTISLSIVSQCIKKSVPELLVKQTHKESRSA